MKSSQINLTRAETRDRHRRRVRVLWGALAALLIAAIAWISTRPNLVPADVVEVQTGPMEVTLDQEGETRVRDRYVVSAPLSGRVLRLELEPGDAVVADETVIATFQPTAPALLDSRTSAQARGRIRAAQSAHGLAKAESERATVLLRFAESEHSRQQRLAASGVISAGTLEAAEVDVETARQSLFASEFAVRTASHDLEIAQAALTAGDGDLAAPIELRSPIDGVVLRRDRQSEGVVAQGTPLIEVADPRRLEVVADFLSTDAIQIRPGLAVRIEQWGGAEALSGSVRRIEPAGFTKVSALGVEEKRVNVVIDIDQQFGRLGDGYRVEVKVVIWETASALKVPTAALFRSGTDWAVFVVDGDDALKRVVEIGQRNSVEAEVLEGLDARDEVVVHPSDELADGVRLERRDL